MSDFETVVIGGGLAGLAAALELQAAGRSVLVVERSARLGGKAGSVVSPVGVFPSGPTSFNGRHPAFWHLLEMLKLDGLAVPLSADSSARFIVRNGALEAIRPNPFSVLTTGALSLSDKWALAKDLFSTNRAECATEDESLDGFLERRFGRAATDHFFAAVMTGIFAGDLKKLSARACMPALVTAEKEYGSVLRGALKGLRAHTDGARPGLYTFKDGFGVIGAAAERALTAWPSTEVVRLERCAQGVRVVMARDGIEVALEASSVVLAVEAPLAASMVASFSARAADLLRACPYAPVALVQWAEQSPNDSKLPVGFGYLSAPVENCFALGTLFVGDLLQETPRRFSSFVGGALAPERARLDDHALFDGIAADVKRLSGGAVGQRVAVTRWERAVFQPPVGHHAMVAELARELEGAPVALAGSYLGGAAMKDALVSGFAAARQLLARSAVSSVSPMQEARA